MDSIFFRISGLLPLLTGMLTASDGSLQIRPIPNPPPPVQDAPAVQMFVPGFTVRELPLEINNINNIVYAPDGRLFLLGYSGNVFQLKDSDGDGLEDQVSLFWDNRSGEIPASIGMCWGPGGLYIACRGRVVRLRDQGDGTSRLEVVTSGWVPPASFGGQNLDAVGIAYDGKGSLYFGLGCDSWIAAYRINAEGKSDYRIESERGTILKVPVEGGPREVIATGLRWSVSLAFNAAGDLFCSDQEGATWLPNGNPFDELLHVQKGRHYGFPPRHPIHLPHVIDEPSLFDYAPQHQSTCSIQFNEPVAGETNTWGPSWWKGDALVTGESRGKIWRTKLVKSAAGYVAQNQLVASLNFLTVDAAPTPQGDLLVACHTGAPDWGTGPQGKGKLFKISYTAPDAPIPFMVYPHAAGEWRVIFDRPIRSADFTKAGASRIEFGPYVAAGDQFETLRPGYKVVEEQMRAPRFSLPILSIAVAEKEQALIFYTPEQKDIQNYAFSIPASFPGKKEIHKELKQLPTVELAGSLQGLHLNWEKKKESWSGWLPHLDLSIAETLTRQSPGHADFWKKASQGGRFRIKTQMNLFNMLRPAVQPGSELDFTYPPERVTLQFKSDGKVQIKSPAGKVKKQEGRTLWTVQPEKDTLIPLEISFDLNKKPELQVDWFTDEDPTPRPLALHRMLVPWATFKAEKETTPDVPSQLTGGRWDRGKALFFSEQLGCAKCHQIRNEGSAVGPDLSNLVHRDYTSVLRDIRSPNEAINPDHLAYEVELKNGESITGVVGRESGDELWFIQPNAEIIQLNRAEIAAMKSSSLSLMPGGLLDTLKESEIRDLMTFLLKPQPLSSSSK